MLTASVAAWEGQIGQIPYASAKAGVVGMTLVAARDLSRALIRVVLDRARRLRHADPQPVLRRDQARPGRPGAAPRSARPAGGVRLDSRMHIVDNPMLNGETIRLDGAIRMAPR